MKQVAEALELLQRPTAKRVALAVAILRSIPPEETGLCMPCDFIIRRYEETAIPVRIRLKKFICAICPKCGSKTFDLNTELMAGSCLSCAFKSKDYKADMKRRPI